MNEQLVSNASTGEGPIEEPRRVSALDLARQVQSGERTAVELVSEALRRAASPSVRQLNAFCFLDHDGALAEAARIDAQLANDEDLGSFAGVPLAAKDLNPVGGWPLCMASDAVDHPVADADTLALAAMRRAGFVLIGSTCSPEFGTSVVTESRRHGVTRNPWNPDYSPGGSSGGSAAAVAAGVTPIAHASDGAGSIRQPASWTGLVGLKPTRGLVPRLFTAPDGFGSEAVLTTTVEDTAAALDVFAAAPQPVWRHDPPPLQQTYLDASRRDPRRLRVGLCIKPFVPMEPGKAGAGAAREAAGMIAALGHDVREVSLDHLDRQAIKEGFIAAFAAWTGGLDIDEDACEPFNVHLRRRARHMNSLDYFTQLFNLQPATLPLADLWGDIDVLLTPTGHTQAHRAGTWLIQQDEGDLDAMVEQVVEVTSYTAVANIMGIPAISIPVVPHPGRMPIGVQLMSRAYGDDLVLALAGQLERTFPWKDRLPTMDTAVG